MSPSQQKPSHLFIQNKHNPPGKAESRGVPCLLYLVGSGEPWDDKDDSTKSLSRFYNTDTYEALVIPDEEEAGTEGASADDCESEVLISAFKKLQNAGVDLQDRDFNGETINPHVFLIALHYRFFYYL